MRLSSSLIFTAFAALGQVGCAIPENNQAPLAAPSAPGPSVSDSSNLKKAVGSPPSVLSAEEERSQRQKVSSRDKILRLLNATQEGLQPDGLSYIICVTSDEIKSLHEADQTIINNARAVLSKHLEETFPEADSLFSRIDVNLVVNPGSGLFCAKAQAVKKDAQKDQPPSKAQFL